MLSRVVLLMVLLVPACGPQKEEPPAEKKSADPWPECARIRKVLRDHSGEPDKLEVEWLGRNDKARKGIVYVHIRYRDTNKFGARQSYQKTAVVTEENVVVRD